LNQNLLGKIFLLKNSKLFRNIVTAVSGTAGAQLINLALIPVIMRIYGPEAFGVLGTFASVNLILISIAALTYPTAIVLPEHERDARSLIRLSLTLGLVVSFAMAAVLLLAGKEISSVLHLEVLSPYLLLLPFTMFTGVLMESCQQWLFRTQQFRLTSKAAMSHAFIYNAVRSSAGLVSPTAPVLVITTALYHAVHSCVLLIGIFWGRTPRFIYLDLLGKAKESTAKVARRYRDFPIFRAPQVFINAVAHNMPTLVLAAMFNSTAAGYFALCAQVLSMPNNLMGKAVGDVYYPRITQAIHRKEHLAPLMLKGVLGLTAIGIIPFTVLSLIGPQLFSFVFGPNWNVAGEYARWLALSEFAGFMARPCLVAIPAMQLQGQYLIIEIASTVLRVAGAVVGGMFFKNPLAVVICYAAANGVIYLSIIVLVLIKSHRLDTQVAGSVV
jgi:O-antigen/teichoic acid export membrane protein